MAEIKRIEARQTFSAAALETTEGVMSTQPYREIDLNSYSDVGSTFESQTRDVMTAGRRPKKGSQISRADSWGYNIDNTVRNVEAQMSAFLYCVPSYNTTRHFLQGHPLVGSSVREVNAATATTITVTGAAPTFAAGEIIVLIDGVNDKRPQVVVTGSASPITVTPLVAGEGLLLTSAMRNGDKEVRSVGNVLAGTHSIQGYADRVTITDPDTTGELGALGLRVGEWVFVGGNGMAVGSNEPFYARVIKPDANEIVFDATTRPISAVAAPIAPNTPIFVGVFMHDDEDKTTFTHMRSLSKDSEGKNQVEVTRGCFASELTVNISERSFVNMDLTYIGSETKYVRMTDPEYAATFGDKLIKADSDAAPINTSTDLYRQRLVIPKLDTINTASIHGLVQELTLALNNTLTEATGIGVLGNDGASAGKVDASGSLTAYFVDLSIMEAVRCNCTASLDIICARKHEGVIYDLPALTLSSNGLTVADDNAVQVAVDEAAFESKYGYVMSYTSFAYLPTEAMPPDASDCDC